MSVLWDALNTKVRVAQIVKESLINGPGVRLVVALQGCNIKCPGCHNPELHDPNGGYGTTVGNILGYASDLTTGITVSGGEPTLQPVATRALLKAAKSVGLDTMMYTGLTKVELEAHPMYVDILENLDLVKIGPYVESLRTLATPYYGSTNQKIYIVERTELKDAKDSFCWRTLYGEDNPV